MARSEIIGESIKSIEYALEKFKCVQAAFPDAKVSGYYNPPVLGARFSSKLVNSTYTNFDFVKGYNVLYVVPFCEVLFKHNDKEETIKIFSSPKRSRLVYLTRDYKLNKRVMKFSRLTFNLKNNNFKDDMLNACRTQIMQFVQANPSYQLDTKHLEPRLKKLLLFT